jgi:Cu2+-exporting ATPase
VEQALSRKPALLRRTDLLARRFVQALLFLAALTGVAWLHRGPALALERVVALLVVACPCAVGLSIPLAVSVALMRAARAGIFVKDPDALERLHRAHVVLLDKTGTLTEGRPAVARWQGDDRAFEFARALELESSHPVALAFRRSGARPVRLVRAAEDVVEAPGKGIAGRLDGHDVRVGNRAHMDAGGAAVPEAFASAGAAMLQEGLTPVFVAMDGQVVGLAGVGDALRPDARATVAALRESGLRVRILSGDHPGVVRRVARELGLLEEDALGGLTPEAKCEHVARLVDDGPGNGGVVMVGDGVNDAAALALADVGIAVHGGTGASIVAADVIFTRAGVAPLLDILSGARRLRGVVRRNLAFSLLYNLAACGLALAGLVTPLLAAVLMPWSSLMVVLSSALTPTFGSRPLAAAEDGSGRGAGV